MSLFVGFVYGYCRFIGYVFYALVDYVDVFTIDVFCVFYCFSCFVFVSIAVYDWDVRLGIYPYWRDVFYIYFLCVR